MKICGLKLDKWRQWLEVLEAEGKEMGWREWLHLAKVGFKLPFNSSARTVWRERMRTCGKCPIYWRPTRQCKRNDLGCRCWTAALAMAKENNCWAQLQAPGGQIGWRR